LKQGPFGRRQSSRVGFDPDGTLPEHHCKKDASGEVRSGRRRMTAVPVVQDRKGMPMEQSLPRDTDWNDRRAEFYRN
jgi:hypothetical protein